MQNSKIGKVEKKKKTGGRKAGTPNKLSLSIKESVLQTFHNLGGVQHMTDWASENPSDFYRICAKLIPQQVNADVNLNVPAEELSENDLISIATGGSSRATKEASSTKDLH